MLSDAEQRALELFNEARRAHSTAHKRYMEFRNSLKLIPKESLTAGQYREFLSLKEEYSKACKARNKAELEFQAAKAGRTLGEFEDGVRIFDKISSIASQTQEPSAAQVAKIEQKREVQRQIYGTFGDPAFEKMRREALRGLGLEPPVEEKKDGLS